MTRSPINSGKLRTELTVYEAKLELLKDQIGKNAKWYTESEMDGNATSQVQHFKLIDKAIGKVRAVLGLLAIVEDTAVIVRHHTDTIQYLSPKYPDKTDEHREAS